MDRCSFLFGVSALGFGFVMRFVSSFGANSAVSSCRYRHIHDREVTRSQTSCVWSVRVVRRIVANHDELHDRLPADDYFCGALCEFYCVASLEGNQGLQWTECA